VCETVDVVLLYLTSNKEVSLSIHQALAVTACNHVPGSACQEEDTPAAAAAVDQHTTHKALGEREKKKSVLLYVLHTGEA